MDRRSFIRLTAAGGGAGIIAPQLVLAELPLPSMAGGVYYTKDAPGRWSGKAQGHLPVIETEKKEAGLAIRVTTPHEMRGCEHYIVKHVLLDGKFGFLQERLFKPDVDKAPISTFELKDYKGPLYALSMCNLHDVWLNVVEL